MLKRVFDFVAAALGLVLLSPVLLTVSVIVWRDSPGPILFRQTRVGRGGRMFNILKFRTMVQGASERGPAITVSQDARVTRNGTILRALKLDELPQLWNVLVGDMSFVGPRPEVPRYVRMFQADYDKILQVRPGITDLASIRFRDESKMLGTALDPEKLYCETLLPKKIVLAKIYLRKSSLCLDLSIILKTLWCIIAA